MITDIQQLKKAAQEACRPGGNMEGAVFTVSVVLELIERLVKAETAASSRIETGWLVENGKQGDELRYRTWKDGLPDWTADHNEATRYSRRIDAERAHQEDEDAYRIVEHAWHEPVVANSDAGNAHGVG